MITRLFRPTPYNLRRLANALRRGETVGVPTETVYGLAANALDATACQAIFRAKKRPSTDPLIVHLADAKDLTAVGVSNELVAKLAAAFWPGPLTMVVKKLPCIPDIVTAGFDSVAVRVPAHPLFRKLIRLAGLPLAAPSANPFGYISPTTAEHVRAGLNGRIRSILDGGPCEIGVESTIVDVRDPLRPVMLRPGGVPVAALEEILGHELKRRTRPVADDSAAVAPGQLSRHYSPRTPITLYRKLSALQIAQIPPSEAAIMFDSGNNVVRHRGDNTTYSLSLDGTGKSAASRLFGLLRELDQRDFSRLHIEEVPGSDPWSGAVNDRLRRAAARR